MFFEYFNYCKNFTDYRFQTIEISFSQDEILSSEALTINLKT